MSASAADPTAATTATTEPAVPKPDHDNFAIRFFARPVAQWNIADYIEENRTLLLTDDGFTTLCGSWVRELERIATAPYASKRKRNAANTLLRRYSPTKEDHVAIRIARNAARDQSKHPAHHADGSPFIVISGSRNVIGGDVSIGSTASGKRKRADHADGDENESAADETDAEEDVELATEGASTPKRPAAAPRFLKSFAASFKDMCASEKWQLQSEPCAVYAEDILYQHFKSTRAEHAAHSWVLDMHDGHVRKCYGSRHWAAINAEIPRLPDLDAQFAAWLAKFAHKSVEQLQHILDTEAPMTPDEASTLSPTDRIARRWAYQVLVKWVALCADPSTFTRNHREFWYIANFWCFLFDSCLATIPGAYMSRGESKSTSAAARKNQKPQPNAPSHNHSNNNNNSNNINKSNNSKRQRVGHFYDGVLSIHEREVGAAEHARMWISHTGNKWTSDTLKVVKVLHDMLHAYRLPGLTVVGLVTAGWHCRLLRVVYVKGNLCAVVADETRKVPTPQEGVAPLLKMLSVVWRMRIALGASLAMITSVNNLSQDQLAAHLINDDQSSTTTTTTTTSTRPHAPPIPRSADTDGK